jgi:nucleoporin POM34
MSFEKSPFAKTLYASGSRKRVGISLDNTGLTTPSPTGSQFGELPSPASPPISSYTEDIVQNSFYKNMYNVSRSKSIPSTPVTPIPNTFRKSSPGSVPTGSWEHPSLQEIRGRIISKELVLKKVVTNVFLLAVSVVLSNIASRLPFCPAIKETYPKGGSYTSYALYLFYLLCLYNIGSGFSVLVKPQEKFEDLPITPSQRKLLGLPQSPKSAKTSPTPPKYVKSSPQARVSPRASPLSRRLSTSSPFARLAPKEPSSPAASSDAVATPTRPSATKPVQPAVAGTSAPGASSSFGAPAASALGPAATTTIAQDSSATATTPARQTFTPSGKYLYMAESSPRPIGRLGTSLRSL